MRFKLNCSILALIGFFMVLSAHSTGHPPVVLITADNVRYDAVDCPELENLCGLKEDGLSYTNAYTHATWTLPSIASLMTGKGRYAMNFSYTGDGYSFQNLKTGDSLSKTEYTLPERLQDNGYTTHGYYEMITAKPGTGLEQGFDTYTAKSENTTLEDFLDEKPEEREFYWLHLKGSHFPFTATKGCRNFTGQVFSRPPEKSFQISDPTESEIGMLRGCYRKEMQEHDRKVGQILEWASENAVIVYAPSHGTVNGDHNRAGSETPIFGHSGPGYEEQLNIPLIIRMGGKQGEIQKLVGMKNVAPTILDYLDVPHNGMAATLKEAENDHLFFNYGVLTKEYKYIEAGNETLLFDLKKDSDEERNIAELRPGLTSGFQELFSSRVSDVEIQSVYPYIGNELS